MYAFNHIKHGLSHFLLPSPFNGFPFLLSKLKLPVEAFNVHKRVFYRSLHGNPELALLLDLRHALATRLVQTGVDLYTVQKLGRWKKISMIMSYAHHYSESFRSSVEVLDRISGKVSTNLSPSKEKGVPALV